MSDELDDEAKDRLVAITRGIANAVPFVGGLLGELITAVIPGQRQERIVSYLRDLAARIDDMEQGAAAAALSHPEKIDLIEAGGYQAARATTEERIQRIAEVVANGLKSDEADIVRRKRLLTLLGEIDDDQVAILAAYGRNYGGRDPEAWDAINQPSPSHLGADKELIDQNQLYGLGKDHLLRLNLLERKFGNLKKGEYPEFDKNTGAFKGNIQISYLGRMLLRDMGVDLPFKD